MSFLGKLAAFGLLTFSLSSASDALPLTELYRQARIKSERLQVQKLNAQQQEEILTQLESKRSLQASLSGRFDRAESWRNGVETFSGWDPSLRLEARLPIYEAGQTGAERESIQAEIAALQQDSKRDDESLAITVTQLFYDILSLRQDLEHLRRSEEVYANRLKTLRSRVQIGRSRQAEVLSSEMQLAQLKAQKSLVEAKLRQSTLQLADLTGITQLESLEDPLASLPEQIPNFRFQGERPEQEALRYRKLASEAKLRVVESKGKPSLDAIAEHQWRHPTPDGDETQRLSLGLGLTWVLYDSGTQSSEKKRALFEGQKIEWQQKQEEREKNLRLSLLIQSVKDSQEEWRRYDEALLLARKNLKVQLQEFENGLITNLEITQALDQKLAFERSRDQALYRSKRAFWEAKIFTEGAFPKAKE